MTKRGKSVVGYSRLVVLEYGGRPCTVCGERVIRPREGLAPHRGSTTTSYDTAGKWNTKRRWSWSAEGGAGICGLYSGFACYYAARSKLATSTYELPT